MNNLTKAAIAALVAAATLFVVFATAGEPSPEGTGPAGQGEPAVAGWRWESYGGVEVQVPDDWGYGTTGTPPCLDTGEAERPARGYVGRPGLLPTIGCAGPSVPPLGKRTAYLWFDSGADAGELAHDGGWVEETRIVDGIALTVLADDTALRTRILDSARPATAGADEGCPSEHAVTTGPHARPDPQPGGLAATGPVESVSICRYGLGSSQRVLSGSRLSGEDAAAVVRAILAAPAGDGPNEPGSCPPEVAYGDEVLLLVVRGGAGTQEVFVRYSGCDGHGIDDGHTHRRLTSQALKPLLSGPHMPSSLSGVVGELIWP